MRGTAQKVRLEVVEEELFPRSFVGLFLEMVMADGFDGLCLLDGLLLGRVKRTCGGEYV